MCFLGFGALNLKMRIKAFSFLALGQLAQLTYSMSKKKRTRFPWGGLPYGPVGFKKNPVYLVQGSVGFVSPSVCI